MPQYKLIYFNFKAIGEPIRFLFNYGGIEYEDNRVSMDEWQAKLKESSPFGQAPLLVVDGKTTLYQSIAIQRYLANIVGLAGNDPLEKVQIDIAAETIWELKTLLFSWFFEKDEIKEGKRPAVLTDQLPTMMERIDKIVSNNGGYLFGGKLTWPDLQYTAIYECLCYMAGKDIESNAPNMKALRSKVHAIPSIKEYVDRRPQTSY